MKHFGKIVLASLFVFVFVPVILLIVHPLWIGAVVKTAVAKIGPTYTGTAVTLSDCGINLYGGRVSLGGFELANPEGCADKTAVHVGQLTMRADVASALSDVAVIHEIALDDVYVSYVKATAEQYNFDVIAAHAKAASSTEAAATEVEPVETPTTTEPSEGGQKVIIEKLTISNLRLSVLGCPIPVPGVIVLTDIGKETRGVSWKGAEEEIFDRLKKQLGALGEGLSVLGVTGLDLGRQGLTVGTAGVTNALEAVKTLDLDAAKDILKGTGKDLESLGKDFKGLGKELKGFGKDLKGLFKQ